MRLDKLTMHADDVKSGSGVEFYGTPIREVSYLDVDVREALDSQRRIRMSLGEESVAVEVLPGEIIKDNIIRRETTAEVLGDRFYDVSENDYTLAEPQPPDYWDDYYAQLEGGK